MYLHNVSRKMNEPTQFLDLTFEFTNIDFRPRPVMVKPSRLFAVSNKALLQELGRDSF